MKKLFYAIIAISISNSFVFAASKKIDWSLCKKEIKEFCSKIKDDHEKHECLEKLPKDKVSKECREKNTQLESLFKAKHDQDHGHGH
jgi:hypothetical protein